MKRVVNLRLLGITLVVGLAASVACFVWYGYRTKKLAQAFAERATSLEDAGEWQKAAAYHNRYLQMEPDDLEASVRLIEALEKAPTSASQQRQLIGLLYQTLGLLPNRHDLQLKLANALLRTGSFGAAETEAGKVRDSESKSEAEQRDAQRIIALAIRAQARPGGRVSIKDAAEALAGALAENPADVELAAATAALYRDYPQESGVIDSATKADEIMDRLVSSAPKDPEARVARYKYRRRYATGTDPRQDLDAALAASPDHVETLLLLANEDIVSGIEEKQTAAEQKLRRIIELKPEEPRGHTSLASLYAMKGRLPEALDVLARGREKLNAPSFEFNVIHTEILLELRRLDDAEKLLAETDIQFRTILSELPAEARTRFDNFLRLSRARIYMARNELSRAIPELNAVCAAVDEAATQETTKQRLQAHAMLATAMAQLGRMDQSAARWKIVADGDPNLLDARRRAGEAYVKVGRPAEAIAQLEAYLQSSKASPDAWITLVQAHLQRQLQLKDQNWSEFRRVLDKAKQKVPQPTPWNLEIAEVVYLQALGTDEAKQQALELVAKLEKSHSGDAVRLRQLLPIYQQLGKSSDVERVLAQYEQVEPKKSARALVRAALWAQQGRLDDAVKLLSEASNEATAEERVPLRVAQAKLLIAAQKIDQAQQLVSDLISANPRSRDLIKLGLEISLLRQDFATSVSLEDALKALTTNDDFDWRFFRARRMVSEFTKLDPHGRSELARLIESLRSERPDWSPVIVLAGQEADRAGNRRQAIDAYRLAIDSGEKRADILERLVTLLNDERRYNEANTYLAQLKADRPADTRLDPMEIALAVHERRLPQALDLAKKSVERSPEDAMRYIWLANLFEANGDAAQAEETFRDLVKRFPKDSRVWNALFSYMIRTKRPDLARRTLERWAEQVPADEPAKDYMLAQGYEALGDVATAEKQYGSAIAKDARNVDARLRLAKLLAARDVAAARQQFEEVLKIDSQNPEARRFLATVLAASGNEEQWDQAVKLLGANDRANGEEAIANDRLRAILLSRRGADRAERLANCEAAQQILSTRVAQSDGVGSDLDRMLLAGICEQEFLMNGDVASLQAARDALRPLVNRETPSPDHLSLYIQLILRYLEREQEGANEAPAEDDQRSVLVDDASERIDELATIVGEDAAVERRIVPIGYRARLLVVKGNRDEALKQLKDFEARQSAIDASSPERAKLLFQLGNFATAIGYHNEAEAWYRQLLSIAPTSYVLLAKSLVEQNKVNDAIEVCLQAAKTRPADEVAIVVTQLLSGAGGGGAEVGQRVQSLITSALEKKKDNPQLLMSLAVRSVTENKYDEAIKLFRQVLALRPNDTLALNNLATLLAERPNQLGEARKYVEQAMTIAGRNPALLDTLGTIMIRSGENEDAVRVLNEAVAGTATDPRYYFHLAVAYQRSGQRDKANEALAAARKHGLDRAILTDGDRSLLASLNEQLLSNAQSQ